MYATVVVDIPDIKHHGFDYLVPVAFIDIVKPGVRVLVPLGNRKVQGYVVGLESNTTVKNTKPIIEVLDIVPSLTKEMIKLAFWMSHYYSSAMYRTLQMLLPPALKTKTEEFARVSEAEQIAFLTDKEKKILDWVRKKGTVKQSLLIKQFNEDQLIIQDLFKSGLLELNKEFKDKTGVNKVAYVKLACPKEECLLIIGELSKQAIKQKQILEYFLMKNLNEIPLQELISQLNISRSTVLSLVKKEVLKIIEKVVSRDPYRDRAFTDKSVILTTEQENILSTLENSFNRKEKQTFLLHGVTGSGKTEIYLHIMEKILQEQKEAILLVPEISLTPQMVERFKGRFGPLVAVLHSQLSHGEKYDEWRRILHGKAKIAVGARSAIFAPFKNLGLIIIDEEHESSYKQEENPKYHARDIALWRKEYHHAMVILGSATPSLESYYKALEKKYQLLELPKRVRGRKLPEVHVVDMKEELALGNRTMFSTLLKEKIEDRISKKEQIVLFLNRRGYSTFVMCRSCGYVMQCPHCEISLTYHHNNQTLRCHYCGYTKLEPKICPECGSKQIRYFGTGTQKVEEELAKVFPGVRVIRMDVDTTSTKGAHEKLLNAFKNQQGDILLGTQMIAKGLDFPKVTLVGVIAADTMLKLPDFRAAERSFQLLTQVSGRAGRHELEGDVVVQTYIPEHYSVEFASKHDYSSFFGKELKNRQALNYPPFKQLILIQFSHPDLTMVMKASERFVREIKRSLSEETKVEILGPVASPISRLKDRYRFQCMIKYNDESDIITRIHQEMNKTQEEIKDRQLLISVDVDPYVLM